MRKDQRDTRIVLFAAAVLSLILLVNTGISIHLLRQNTINERSGQLANLTLILAEQASQTMFSAKTMLNSMIESLDQANIKTPEQYNAFASQHAQFLTISESTKSNPIIDVATFVATDGRVINFSRQYPPPAINLSDRDYFQWLSKNNDDNTFYSLPVQNKGNGKWVFYLAKRVQNAQNELLGIVLVGVSVEVFTELYKKIAGQLGQGAGLSLYRDDRTLLVRWPYVEELIGTKNNNSSIRSILEQTAYSQKTFFTSEPRFTEKTASADRMISFQKLERYPLLTSASMTSELYLSGSKESIANIFFTTLFSLLFLLISTALLLKAYQRTQQSQFLAEHDRLTTLPNRLLLEDRMKQALAFAKRNNKKFALIYVDIDRFKQTNDSLGHGAGDELLRETAKRLLSSIRQTDTASRVGGDEFVVLLYDVETIEAARKVAENILDALRKDIPFSGYSLKTTASIGISIYPEHGQDVDTLQKHADFAMYIAKSNGRNQVQVFSLV
jgi:diguanylate cyclase (GGDEF)-like protein